MPNPDGTPYNPADGLRDPSSGRYLRNPETANRDAQAARLRSQGHTYQQIADQLGFNHRREAQTAVDRAIADVIREPAESVLHFELERLDAQLLRLAELEEAARKVLATRHITVNNGHVIYHPGTEEPIEDDGPVLQAIDRLVKIEDARNRNAERRAKLTGVDAALKVDATVHEVTQQDLELQEMIRDAKARVWAEEQALRGSVED
jgi:ribosomal protein S4